MPLGVEAMTRAVAKRARRGLYAGRRVLFGNRISDDGGNKTRRKWKPNAQRKHLFSELLGRMVDLRVTTAALRNIDKAGGLDAYIMHTPDKHLDSDKALQLREEMLRGLQARTAAQQLQQQTMPAAAAALLEQHQQQQQQNQQQQPQQQQQPEEGGA